MNTPISDVLAVRFSFHTRQDPGYINIHLMDGNPKDEYGPNGLAAFNSLQSNVFGGGEFLKNVNSSEDGGGRVAVRFKPNDQFDATLAFMYDSNHTNSLPNYEPVLQTSQNPLTANQFQLQHGLDRQDPQLLGRLCRYHLRRARRQRHRTAAHAGSGHICRGYAHRQPGATSAGQREGLVVVRLRA